MPLDRSTWGPDDSVVAAGPWRDEYAATPGVKVPCEGCGAWLVIFPITAERLKQPDWHVLGKYCCMPILRSTKTVIEAGRFKHNKLVLNDVKES